MKKTKKHSMLKTVFKVICAIAAVVGTVFAGMAVLLRKSMKKLKNHERKSHRKHGRQMLLLYTQV